MGLFEVARFASLTEAQIAAGALQSAGFHVEVYDSDIGTVDPLLQQALGGFRLMAPDAERPEARAFLAEIAAQAPPREAAPTGGPGRALGALVLGILFGWAAGFPTAKTGRRLPDE